MNNPTTFSCYLIGGDTLLMQCGELLLSSGNRIAGVVTGSPAISQWAAGHNLRVLSTEEDFGAELQADDFDYLFAITHLELIPESVVRSPRKLAINFHDGPLPEYAGLNAPMWALLNGESAYGITWHAMQAGVDTGDVLLRHSVSISDADTALSLNTKCFAAALESFPVLVNQLQRESFELEPQNLSRRTYFGRFQKPPFAGLLDWRSSSVEIDRLVRALNTGNYENTLASAKVELGTGCYIVDQARSLPLSGVPGELLSVHDEGITVAAQSGAVALERLRRLDGRPTLLREVVEQEGLSVGGRLTVSPPDELEAELKSMARREHHWVEELASAEVLSLPYRSQTSQSSRSDERGSLSIPIPKGVVDLLGLADAAAGAFAAFLARLLAVESISVAVAGRALDLECNSCAVANHGFVSIHMDPALNIRENVVRATNATQRGVDRGPWLRDVVARHASFGGNSLLAEDAVLPVAVIFGSTCSEEASCAELVFRSGDDADWVLDYSKSAYSDESARQLSAHFAEFLKTLAARPETPFRDVVVAGEEERQNLLEHWNQTDREYDPSECVHRAFERQAAETPTDIAIADATGEVTFEELDRRVSSLAQRLRHRGVTTEGLVGIHVPRSIDLVVATLAVLKAGGAYVPLDPDFPTDRLELMIEDSAMPLVISHSSVARNLPSACPQVMCLDEPEPIGESCILPNCEAEQLAYVIYTSGSTGRPKGVMIEHRNVMNFFTAMDECVPRDQQERGVWLAVTSLSFDISVLELLWTLTRGFKVVIFDEQRARGRSTESPPAGARPLDLGLFMWGNDDAPGPDKYRLLMEGARYFDANGFTAVWTPERHFHAFGGPYPNPAVTGAAVAAVTTNVKIRAGSCVIPLHHPVRVAEEWAVVDNLSNGRVEIAAASGWNPNDFVLRPENHADNKRKMYEQLEQIRALWRGETLKFPGPLGTDVEVQSLPRPVQPELPCWITTAGNPETWRQAGMMGLNVLTHLLGQSVQEITEKVRVYRQAREEAGYDPAAGRVALMLHTLVGEDKDAVRELVREPMKSYLSSSMKLAMDYAWSFPAFKRPGGSDTRLEDVDLKTLSAEETDTILEFAFERYFETSGLFGDVQTCVEMLSRCAAAGVDEIACLLDFGVDTQTVLESLPRLTVVKDHHRQSHADTSVVRLQRPYSFADEVRRHGVTHMQCTPSSARMLLSDSEAKAAVGNIRHLLLGGEALPSALAEELTQMRPGGTLINMYGPTETTIWSLTHRLDSVRKSVPIGRPIANTRAYVLDRYMKPVPIGVSGELYIGGDGVARGYLNRPELTAERFRTDPYCPGGSPVYATGDLVRYRPDGVIEFIGRTDFQVKVRGYRIELGEVEHRLESLDAVAEAVVLLRGESDMDHRLVAFVVGVGKAPDSIDLRNALRASLPEYMVPNDFIILPEMPRTANGKLDRAALLQVRSVQPRKLDDDSLPNNETEALIADLWKKTLRLEAVGLSENFFDLGGHSLLVVQLHGQLKQALGRPISLTDLYQYPTISSLAGYLTGGDDRATVAKASSRGERRRAMRQRRIS